MQTPMSTKPATYLLYKDTSLEDRINSTRQNFHPSIIEPSRMIGYGLVISSAYRSPFSDVGC